MILVCWCFVCRVYPTSNRDIHFCNELRVGLKQYNMRCFRHVSTTIAVKNRKSHRPKSTLDCEAPIVLIIKAVVFDYWLQSKRKNIVSYQANRDATGNTCTYNLLLHVPSRGSFSRASHILGPPISSRYRAIFRSSSFRTDDIQQALDESLPGIPTWIFFNLSGSRDILLFHPWGSLILVLGRIWWILM